MEFGSQGFLIGCNRCASYKVPLRDVRHCSRNPVTKRLTFKNNSTKDKKGVPYLGFLIGCNRCASCKVPLRDVRHCSRDPVTKRLTFENTLPRIKRAFHT
jgi:hypothetical protein